MKALIKILEDFDKNRVKGEDWSSKTIEEKHKAIADWFRPCAERILCNGYFLVNGEYIIDLGAIELYYHEEEEGGIKDYIMYHTNAHSSKSKVYKLNNDSFPYFKFGSFNLHHSGVDVTFENEEEKYRASFLIRSYRLLRKGEEQKLNDLTIPFDKCSTHIFDDMFYDGIILGSPNNPTIEWKECSEKGKLKNPSIPRRNVTKRECKYDEKKKRYVINKLEEPDLRPWLFIREGIKE